MFQFAVHSILEFLHIRLSLQVLLLLKGEMEKDAWHKELVEAAGVSFCPK